MRFVTVDCASCDKRFDKEVRHYNENMKIHNKFYCSRECVNKGHLRRIKVTCSNPSCHKIFERQLGDISSRNFCSHHCSATITNQSRPKVIKTCPKCNCQFHGSRKYCSLGCVPKTQPKYSREDLLDKIKQFHKLHKRIPVKREFYSNWQAFRRVFGNWNSAIVAAGFAPNPEKFTHRCIAKDGHKCDSLAEKIIDEWLVSKNVLHQRNVYYPGQTKFTVDFLIDNKHWIEFPGLIGQLASYDAVYKRKKVLAKKQGIDIVEILPEDLFPHNRLDRRLSFLLQ